MASVGYSPARRASLIDSPQTLTRKARNPITGLTSKGITEQSFAAPGTQFSNMSHQLRHYSALVRNHLKYTAADPIDVGGRVDVDIPNVGRLSLVALTTTADS